MKLYLSEFFNGLHERLTAKTAEDIFSIPNDTSIFPTIDTQQRWKFARCDEGIHLNDGQKVHSFKFKHDESTENDFAMEKKPDVPFHNFAQGADYEGTAQVHRANPGMLYVTLHDGKENPTYTFKHVHENQWRAIPKVKKAEEALEVDHSAFLNGLIEKSANSGILDTVLKGIDTAGRGVANTAMAPGFNPLGAAGLGLLGGAAYDLGKRNLYNTDEENAEEGLGKRLFRYAAPAALLGGTGLLTKDLFPDYYNHYPLYKK